MTAIMKIQLIFDRPALDSIMGWIINIYTMSSETYWNVMYNFLPFGDRFTHMKTIGHNLSQTPFFSNWLEGWHLRACGPLGYNLGLS